MQLSVKSNFCIPKYKHSFAIACAPKHLPSNAQALPHHKAYFMMYNLKLCWLIRGVTDNSSPVDLCINDDAYKLELQRFSAHCFGFNADNSIPSCRSHLAHFSF